MFNDDDQPIAPASNAGFSEEAEKAWVMLEHEKEAPLATNTVRVLLNVSGSSSSKVGRAALDLVVVLDVSGSMGGGGKLDKIKSAMDFVIKKLSPTDRLAIVSFSNVAIRLCPLRAMSAEAKSDLKGMVDSLAAGSGTNIKAGLETGLQVLGDREYTAGRTASILLLSDGKQNHGDARQLGNPWNLPVYTIALGGAGADMKLLQKLASAGGTFNPVLETGGMGLIAVISQVLAGLLTVVVQDLYLILSKPTCPGHIDLDKIVNVDPGDFYLETESHSGTVTVMFGDVFRGEGRKVIVDLLLVEASGNDYKAGVLDVKLSWSLDAQGTRQKFTSKRLDITRTNAKSSDPWAEEFAGSTCLQVEEVRRHHAHSISEARSLADERKLDDARDKLIQARNSVEDIPELREELQLLLDLMESQELYEAEGCPYALASETSHGRQRFASRGVEAVRFFTTRRMNHYLQQANQFAEDTNATLPTADEDEQEENSRRPQFRCAFYNLAIEKMIQASSSSSSSS